MRFLSQRILTALVALPLVIAFLYVGQEYDIKWAVLGLVALLTAISCWEFAKLVQEIGVSINPTFFSVISSIFVVGVGILGESYLPIILAIFFVLLLLENLPQSTGVLSILWSLAGLIYLPMLLHFLYVIYLSANGFSYLLWLLALVWAYDSGAYLVGSLWGHHKLAPALSPKKSWEGVAGGLVFSMVVGVLAAILLPWNFTLEIALLHSLAIALLVSGFAQVGDLFESKLKRQAEVKDTGNLFPGHGGMLDRIDALLIATPIFFFYLKVILQWL
ncbi:phosphatidate cytidylyltransferase [Candidatus Acetothermia bacterium]|nr:phosphatidate cytidylyltransferase [Candidatus Acetothermia bacterium]MBI3644080.1 phosphatidate cytidylyltransferase [Candidatus Acetothermia bacterium]